MPLTYFTFDGNDPLNMKVYGDTVWNRWIDTHFGQDTVRNAWAASLGIKPKSFAPAAYDAALRANGTSFFDTFSRFATGPPSGEPRAADSTRANLPGHAARARRKTGAPITLAPTSGAVRGRLRHASFGLVNVRRPNVPQIKLVLDDAARPAASPPRSSAAWATSSADTPTSAMTELPQRRPRRRHDRQPGPLLAHHGCADQRRRADHRRVSNTFGDWVWKSDDVSVAAHVSTDFKPPSVLAISPRRDARGVSTKARLRVVFSEPLAGLDVHHVSLVGPGGHRVRFRIRRHGSTIQIVPLGHLHRGSRYTIRFGGGIEDGGGNRLPPATRSWTFNTGR